MSKISDYLRRHLTGEVSTDSNIQQAMSHDGSIFEITPQITVFPRTTNDIRKVMRFAWRLAERGQVLPLTARGGGTSATGSAIGSGATLLFGTYMSHILELDIKSQMVRVQPGLNYSALEEAMATHGLTLPVQPSNSKVATIGGALASNAIGAKSVKYGELRDWTDRLEVVLSNGEIIQTERLSKRELSAKKGLQTMEGEIYRALDALIDDNAELLENANNLPYAINLVKDKDGSFDLTPLVIGSEGTLGMITQAIFRLTPRFDEVELIAAALADEQDLVDLTDKILELEPSEFEFIDGKTLKLISEKNGGTPWEVVSKKLPSSMIFVEFDDKKRERKIKKAAKILSEAGVRDAKIASDFEDQEVLRSAYHSVSYITNFNERGDSALPLGADISVDPTSVENLVDGLKKLLKRNHLKGGIWGHLGMGNISVWPVINLANLGQRQAVFKFMNEVRALVREIGGSTGNINSGRLGSPFTENQYGADIAKIIKDIKTIFDPYNTLNPGVKTGLSQNDLVADMRKEYNRLQFAEFNLRD